MKYTATVIASIAMSKANIITLYSACSQASSSLAAVSLPEEGTRMMERRIEASKARRRLCVETFAKDEASEIAEG